MQTLCTLTVTYGLLPVVLGVSRYLSTHFIGYQTECARAGDEKGGLNDTSITI